MVEEMRRAKKSSKPESNDTMSGNPSSEETDAADSDLEKIQEILFGKQMRHNNEQIREMRTDLEQQIARLAESQNQQLGNLQRTLDTTLEQINQRFVAFDRENQVKLSTTNDKLIAAERSLTEKIAQFSKNSIAVQDQLKMQIDQTKQNVDQSIDVTRASIMQHVESSLIELRTQNVDRSALSSLLGEVANQLSDQSSKDIGGSKNPQPMGKANDHN